MLALDDSSVSLLLDGRGEVVLADNASLRLAQRESSGEYSAVTGVRAPVLFLFPCGDSEIRLGEELSFTFGINHSLDKIAGLKGFEIYGLHDDRAFELGFPEGAEAMEGAELLASFEARDDPSKEGYTWYRVDARPADGAAFEVGEYSIFIAARRGNEKLRLGQSTLLYVESGENEAKEGEAGGGSDGSDR